MEEREKDGSWFEWRRHVLMELKDLRAELDVVCERQYEQKVEFAVMRVKAGIWGALGAAIPTLVAVAIMIYGFLSGVKVAVK